MEIHYEFKKLMVKPSQMPFTSSVCLSAGRLVTGVNWGLALEGTPS